MNLFNVYMVLNNGMDCWWKGEAFEGQQALELAWQYAEEEPFYNSFPISWEIDEI